MVYKFIDCDYMMWNREKAILDECIVILYEIHDAIKFLVSYTVEYRISDHESHIEQNCQSYLNKNIIQYVHTTASVAAGTGPEVKETERNRKERDHSEPATDKTT